MQRDPIIQEPMPALKSPDEKPALPAPYTPQDAAREAAREKARPSGASVARRIFTWVLVLGLVLVVMAGLAAAVYFGWPRVYANYILPVQNNTAKLAVLEGQQQAGQEQLVALQTQVPGLAAAQSDQSAVVTAQAARIGTLESAIKANGQSLATAQAEQAAALTGLENSIKKQNQALTALQSTQAALQAGDASRRTELEQQVTLLKSMELLSRARLFLYESNFGMAKQDVQAARDLLAGLLALPEAPLDQGLTEVVQRLDQTLARLPDFPVAANDDLNIAWQILLSGQTQPTASAEGTQTPESTGTPGFTPTPTP